MSLKVVFFGTPEFAATILEKLIEAKIHVVAVVTRGDQKSGRHLKLKPPPVKLVAHQHQIPCFQPIKASAPEFLEELKKLEADLFIVAAYSEILKQALLDIPKLDCINVHASLLPKYRGAAPIHYALLNGEKETGVTIMKVVKRLDAGDMIQKGRIEIEKTDTTGSIEKKLSLLGAELLLDVIKKFETNQVVYTPQDESLATYAPKVTPEDGLIDFTQTSERILHQIQACHPKPGAWCFVTVQGQSKRLLVKEATICLEKGNHPGQLLSKKKLIIATQDGSVHLTKVQLEGKKEVDDQSFLNGFREKISSFH